MFYALFFAALDAYLVCMPLTNDFFLILKMVNIGLREASHLHKVDSEPRLSNSCIPKGLVWVGGNRGTLAGLRRQDLTLQGGIGIGHSCPSVLPGGGSLY